ncbi:MAG: hypothetical protein PWQ67_2310 [Clostridia bacterium]|jgi:hypothetical protein|nr:hypothetical protein [Clostridia bacterium]
MNAPILYEEEEIVVEVSVDGELENVLVKKVPCCIW